MRKDHGLRLKPGQVVRVQYGNGRPLPKEKCVTVQLAVWTTWERYGQRSKLHVATIPMKASEAKATSAEAHRVVIRDTEGNDWDSRELAHILEKA